MTSRRLQFLAIFFTVFIDILGFGIVIPVLPLYAEHFGATPVAIGWLIGIFSLMQFIFAPVWGKISDRHGRKPVLVVGMAGTAAGYLLMGFAGSLLMLFVARVIDGIAGANIGAAQAYLADISKPDERAKAMGLVGAAFGLGFVFGPALGGWAGATFHYSTPMFIAAGLSLANLAFVTFYLPESLPPEKRGGGGRAGAAEVLRHIRAADFLWGAGAYCAAIIGFSMLTTLFALYLAHRFGIDARGTGFILAGIGIIGILIQGGLIGRLAKTFGEGRLAVAGCLTMAAGLGILAVAREVPLMLTAAALAGIGNSLVVPSLNALASRAADERWQGRALGLMQSAGSLARFVGPMLAGLLLAAGSSLPYAGLAFLVSAAILLVAAIICLPLARRTPASDPVKSLP